MKVKNSNNHGHNHGQGNGECCGQGHQHGGKPCSSDHGSSGIFSKIIYLVWNMIIRRIFYMFINPKFCLDNQLPRLYGNIIIIIVIYYGSYCDLHYWCYHMKNSFDRKFEAVWISFIFIYTTGIYIFHYM